jgi:hypothetical protein
MTKPARSRGRVNAAVVHRRRMFLFGEICPTWRWAVEAKEPAGPYWSTKVQALRAAAACGERNRQWSRRPTQRAAQQCASVIGQKSAEGVVAQCSP